MEEDMDEGKYRKASIGYLRSKISIGRTSRPPKVSIGTTFGRSMDDSIFMKDGEIEETNLAEGIDLAEEIDSPKSTEFIETSHDQLDEENNQKEEYRKASIGFLGMNGQKSKISIASTIDRTSRPPKVSIGTTFGRSIDDSIFMKDGEIEETNLAEEIDSSKSTEFIETSQLDEANTLDNQKEECRKVSIGFRGMNDRTASTIARTSSRPPKVSIGTTFGRSMDDSINVKDGEIEETNLAEEADSAEDVDSSKTIESIEMSQLDEENNQKEEYRKASIGFLGMNGQKSKISIASTIDGTIRPPKVSIGTTFGRSMDDSIIVKEGKIDETNLAEGIGLAEDIDFVEPLENVETSQLNEETEDIDLAEEADLAEDIGLADLGLAEGIGLAGIGLADVGLAEDIDLADIGLAEGIGLADVGLVDDNDLAEDFDLVKEIDFVDSPKSIEFIESSQMDVESLAILFPPIRKPLPYKEKPKRFFKSGPLSQKLQKSFKKSKNQNEKYGRFQVINLRLKEKRRSLRQVDDDVYVFRDDLEFTTVTAAPVPKPNYSKKKKRRRRTTIYDGAWKMLREAFAVTFCGLPSKINEANRKAFDQRNAKKKRMEKSLIKITKTSQKLSKPISGGGFLFGI